MTMRQLLERLEKVEAGLGTRQGAALVVWACDESEDEALARAQAQGQALTGDVLVIKRFCQTIAEDRRRRELGPPIKPMQ